MPHFGDFEGKISLDESAECLFKNLSHPGMETNREQGPRVFQGPTPQYVGMIPHMGAFPATVMGIAQKRDGFC